VWPLVVAVTPPGLEHGAGVGQRAEQRLIQGGDVRVFCLYLAFREAVHPPTYAVVGAKSGIPRFLEAPSPGPESCISPPGMPRKERTPFPLSRVTFAIGSVAPLRSLRPRLWNALFSPQVLAERSGKAGRRAQGHPSALPRNCLVSRSGPGMGPQRLSLFDKPRDGQRFRYRQSLRLAGNGSGASVMCLVSSHRQGGGVIMGEGHGLARAKKDRGS